MRFIGTALLYFICWALAFNLIKIPLEIGIAVLFGGSQGLSAVVSLVSLVGAILVARQVVPATLAKYSPRK